VYVGYTPDGFDLFRMPYLEIKSAASGLSTLDSRLSTLDSRLSTLDFRLSTLNSRPRSPDAVSYIQKATSEYAPWPTLGPTSWFPIVEADRDHVSVGAATGGSDVLGYHAWAASATWLVSSPADAPAVSAVNPDWQLWYAYGRWWPTLWAAASSTTSFFGGPPTDAGLPSTITLREQQVEAGALFPIRHTRVSHTVLGSLVRAVDDFMLVDREVSRDRTAARAGWSAVSAHTYGYSISPERGLAAGVTTELVRRAFGSSADATAISGDVRAYLPGAGRHHVLAARIAAGVATGDRNLRRVFVVGGGDPNTALLDFGHNAISLLRGFPANTFAGRRVALLNVDYRFPIARPQRGIGTLPVFLRTIHAAAFGDVGHAWTRDFDAHDLKTSIGGELSFDIVAGYWLPFTTTVGVGRGHDGAGTVPDRTTVYVRVGRAF
jgi:hypothetical protein